MEEKSAGLVLRPYEEKDGGTVAGWFRETPPHKTIAAMGEDWLCLEMAMERGDYEAE